MELTRGISGSEHERRPTRGKDDDDDDDEMSINFHQFPVVFVLRGNILVCFLKLSWRGITYLKLVHLVYG